MAGLDFATFSTGNPYTTIDTYYATSTVNQTVPPTQAAYPNGALAWPGEAYLAPVTTFGLLGQKGQGAPLVLRYVRYNSTANPALLAYPAPVCWTDETFQTVSGVFSEGNPSGTGNLNSFAGLLLVNTTSVSGLTAAALNGNWVWIATSGYVPGAYVPAATAIGDSLTMSSGNFTLTRTASGTAPISKRILQALTAISSGNADVLVDTDWTY
jgi:hypothetical protein